MDKFFRDIFYQYTVDIKISRTKTEEVFDEFTKIIEGLSKEYSLEKEDGADFPKDIKSRAIAYKNAEDRTTISMNIVKQGDIFLNVSSFGHAESSANTLEKVDLLFRTILKTKKTSVYSEFTANGRGIYVSSDSQLANDKQWLTRIYKVLRPRGLFEGESEDFDLTFTCGYKDVFNKEITYEQLTAKDDGNAPTKYALGISLGFNYRNTEKKMTALSIDGLIDEFDLEEQLVREGDFLDKIVISIR